MRDRSRVIAGFVIIALGLPAWRASFAAPQDRYRLAWHSVESCPTESDVRARIDRILGSIASSGDVLDANVSVKNDDSFFRAHLVLTAKGQSSERDVDGDSCNAVADAAALIVALAIDPNAIRNLPPPSASPTSSASSFPSPSPSPSSSASPSPSPSSSSSASPSSSSSPQAPPIAKSRENKPVSHPPADDLPEVAPPYFFTSAAYVIDSATLPGIGSGVAIDLGYRPRHLEFAASGFWLGARDTHLASKPNEGAGISASGIGARACYEPFDDRLEIAPCAGADVTWLLASGFGADVPTDNSARLFRFVLGGRAAYRFWRVALFAGAGAAIPLTRPDFVIQNAGVAHRVAPVSFVGQIGGEFHF